MLASNPVTPNSVFGSVITTFRDWLRKRRMLRQYRHRLDGCDQNEIARIARDVGLSSNELREMAELGPDAAKLMLERMAVLHLDATALAKNEPSTMRDMQRLCSKCASKKRCKLDLMLVPNDPAWRQYCPNAGTLDAVQSEAANIR